MIRILFSPQPRQSWCSQLHLHPSRHEQVNASCCHSKPKGVEGQAPTLAPPHPDHCKTSFPIPAVDECETICKRKCATLAPPLIQTTVRQKLPHPCCRWVYKTICKKVCALVALSVPRFLSCIQSGYIERRVTPIISMSLQLSAGPTLPFSNFFHVFFTNSAHSLKSNQGHSLVPAGQWLPRVGSCWFRQKWTSLRIAPDSVPRQTLIASKRLLSTWFVAGHICHFVCISFVVLIAKEGPHTSKPTIRKPLACLRFRYTAQDHHNTKQ